MDPESHKRFRAFMAKIHPDPVNRFRETFAWLASTGESRRGSCPCCEGEIAFGLLDGVEGLAHSRPPCAEFKEALRSLEDWWWDTEEKPS
jgi:hypothetical protein